MSIQRHAVRAAPISNMVAFKAVTPAPVHTRLVPQGLAPVKERRDCSLHAGYKNCRHTDVEPQAMSNENQCHREKATAKSSLKIHGCALSGALCVTIIFVLQMQHLH